MSVNVNSTRMSADLFLNSLWVEGRAGKLEAIRAVEAVSWLSAMLPSQRGTIIIRTADRRF